jgi:CRISPR system Cascade subunit CasA
MGNQQAAPPSFSLTDQPWIKAITLDGTEIEVSLRNAFVQAGALRRLSGELPTQAFAVLRIMLAVLHRAIAESDDDRYELWADLWRRRALPQREIARYLDSWTARFDLFDANAPFMQVAGLHTAKNEVGDIAKIIADVPANSPLFTTRSGHELTRLSFGEAARWLVHVQAFDVSGIKSGTVGDKSVKGGKSYPIGTGWAGRLGGVFVEGGNLLETLLLNLITDPEIAGGIEPDDEDEPDLPTWERPPQRPEDVPRTSATGPVDLMTWTARRVRLVPENGVVVGMVLTNGDKLLPQNMHRIEHFTPWRRSQTQEKQLKLSRVYMPRTHTPQRAMWRGLSNLLPGAAGVAGTDPDNRPPGVVRWVSELEHDGALSTGHKLCLHATGIAYGTQSAVVLDLIDDSLAMAAGILQAHDRTLPTVALQAVGIADDAVGHLGGLAKNIAVAQGASGDDLLAGARDAAFARAYGELDQPYRRWLAQLNTETDNPLADWGATVRVVLSGIADELVDAAGPAGFVGHQEPNHPDNWMTTSRARATFDKALRKVLPEADSGAASINREGGN